MVIDVLEERNHAKLDFHRLLLVAAEMTEEKLQYLLLCVRIGAWWKVELEGLSTLRHECNVDRFVIVDDRREGTGHDTVVAGLAIVTAELAEVEGDVTSVPNRVASLRELVKPKLQLKAGYRSNTLEDDEKVRPAELGELLLRVFAWRPVLAEVLDEDEADTLALKTDGSPRSGLLGGMNELNKLRLAVHLGCGRVKRGTTESSCGANLLDRRNHGRLDGLRYRDAKHFDSCLQCLLDTDNGRLGLFIKSSK